MWLQVGGSSERCCRSTVRSFGLSLAHRFRSCRFLCWNVGIVDILEFCSPYRLCVLVLLLAVHCGATFVFLKSTHIFHRDKTII